MDLNSLKLIGLAHLEEYLPCRHDELVRTGELDQYLENAARNTKYDLDAAVAAGYTEHEAWEMVRERYLILPAEDYELDEPYPAAELFEGLRDLHRLLSEAEDELAKHPASDRRDRDSED